MKPKSVRTAAVVLALASIPLALPASLSAEEAEPRIVLRGHTDAIASLAFTPDGKTLLSASYDSSIRFWDIKTSRCTKAFKEPDDFKLCSMALSPDGKTLALGGVGNKILLRDVASGRGSYLRDTYRTAAPQVVFSPDGRYLASGSGCVDEVDLWDVNSGLKVATFKVSEYGATALVFTPDSKTLASVEYRHGIKLWDVATGKRLNALKIRPLLRDAALSPDGKSLAAVATADDEIVYLWEVATGKLQRTLKIGGFATGQISFSPDGSTLAVGGKDGRIKLWSVADGRERASFKGHAKEVTRLAFSQDGKILASGSEDGTIMLWDVGARK